MTCTYSGGWKRNHSSVMIRSASACTCAGERRDGGVRMMRRASTGANVTGRATRPKVRSKSLGSSQKPSTFTCTRWPLSSRLSDTAIAVVSDLCVAERCRQWPPNESPARSVTR